MMTDALAQSTETDVEAPDALAAPAGTPTLEELNQIAATALNTVDAIERELTLARRRFGERALQFHSEESEAGRAAIDAELPMLADAEQEHVAHLDRLTARISEALATFDTVGWRPDLLPSELSTFHALIPVLRADIDARPVADILRDIRTAIAYGDTARMAAYGSLGREIEEKPASFGERGDVAAALRQCRQKVRDGGASVVEDRLLEVKAKVAEARSDIVQRANQHIPGQLGNGLERHVFGQFAPGRKPIDADRYNRDKLEDRVRWGGR